MYKHPLSRAEFFSRYAIQMIKAQMTSESSTLKMLGKLEQRLSKEEEKRLDYYFKINAVPNNSFELPLLVKNFHSNTRSLQYHDFLPLIKRFDSQRKFNVWFGDITSVPEVPTFVKSRPIVGDNENSVLLKLGSLRHFTFVKDRSRWKDKAHSAIWRGHAHNPQRQQLVKLSVNSTKINAAQTNKNVSVHSTTQLTGL